MSQAKSNSTCLVVCILAGLLAGAFSWWLLSGSVSVFPLLILFGFISIATAYFLHEAFCGGEEEETAELSTSTETKVASVAAATAATAVASNFVSSDEKKEASTSEAKSEAKPAAKKAPAKKTTKTKTAAAKAPAKTKAAAKSAPAKAKAGPERLKKPKGGKADDLKLISGVGPKLETTLNGLGFWHFEQIAKWKKADVSVVDDQLKFKGRIERDDWIKQAKALAKGGEAEYIKVFGKKPR